MTQDELIEKVARAICVMQGIDPDFMPDDEDKALWEFHIPEATAAIRVVLEEAEVDG